MRRIRLLVICAFVLALGCRTSQSDYWLNDRVLNEAGCFQTVYIGQGENKIVFETDPGLARKLRAEARNHNASFRFVDSLESADIAFGAVTLPRAVTTHADAQDDRTWGITIVTRPSARAPFGPDNSNYVLVEGEATFGVSLTRQILRAVERIQQRACGTKMK